MIIYKFFKYLYLHVKYVKILNKVYEDENLIENLSKLFDIKFKRDWVGRIYTVINPYIQDGKFKNDSHIFEMGDDGLNNNEYIEQYIMQKLVVADRFIYTNNLFDLLTYSIKKLDKYGNYLFIMKPITYDDFIMHTKRFLMLLGGLMVVGLGIIIYLNLK